MGSISKSVGSGGKNVRTDVMTVQNLLIKSARYLPDTGLVLPSGTSDGRTVAAIFEFQRRVGGMSKGDGRVDPGGNTLKLLNDTAMGKKPGAGADRADSRIRHPASPCRPRRRPCRACPIR